MTQNHPANENRYRPSRLSRRASLSLDLALDQEALRAADVVVINARGAMYERLRDGLIAYLYSAGNIRQGRYPSDAEVAAVVELAREARKR